MAPTIEPSNPSSSQTTLLSPELASQLLTNSVSPNHVASIVPIKLTRDNFLLWKNILTLVLQNYGMYELVNGSELPPPQVINNAPNSAHAQWLKKDRTCRLWITSSLSESILPYTIGATTARSLWLTLERRFSALTRSHVLQLRRRIQSIRKGNISITDFLQQVKEVADALAAAGEPLNDSDLVAHILHGLPPEYEAFNTSIRVRAEPVTSDELHGLLLSQEIELDLHSSQHVLTQPLPPAHAFAASYNRSRNQQRGPNSNFRSVHRPRFPNQYISSHPTLPNSNSNPPLLPRPPFPASSSHTSSPNPNRPRPRCQICSMLNHTAIDCYNRWNHAYQGRVPPARLAAMVAPSRRTQSFPSGNSTNNHFMTESLPSEDQNDSLWYIDSGATNHITPDLSNLHLHNDYSGPDQVSVANGQGSQFGERSLSRGS